MQCFKTIITTIPCSYISYKCTSICKLKLKQFSNYLECFIKQQIYRLKCGLITTHGLRLQDWLPMNIDQNCVNNKKVTFWLAVPNNVSQLAIIANILYVLYSEPQSAYKNRQKIQKYQILTTDIVSHQNCSDCDSANFFKVTTGIQPQ